MIQAIDKTNSVTDFIPKDEDEESFKLYPDTSVIPYSMKDQNRNESVRFKVVLVDAKDKEREGQKYGFATNMDVNRNNSKIVEYLYDKRWGIETSYRVGKDFLAKTTSKNYLIRLFFFQFSMILYNCWVIVNALLGIAMFGHVPQKPIVSAKLFGTVLYSIIKDDIT